MLGTLRPVRLLCSEWTPHCADGICAGIANVEHWSDFHGYGPVPGILHAEYEVQTDGMVGSRIRVRNQDGSSHVEEIVTWDPPHAATLRMYRFSAPLDRFATHFVEDWRMTPHEGGTLIERTLTLHPRNRVGRALLQVVGFFLRRAIRRHLRQIRAGGPATSAPSP